MNQVMKTDPETGEILSTAIASVNADTIPLAVKLAKVELDQAISTAKAYPRSMTQVRDRISELVMLDEQTAVECVYALPRGGKPIRGPSVRFAEIVASQYGNCKVGSRVVDVDKFLKFVEAEGVFIDLESGMQRTARIRRKISDKHGRVYNDDMIVVTGNAACAIALREAILKGVPKALWRRAYDEAEGVIAGDIKTLAERRDGAVKAFAAWGVTPDQIFASLDLDGLDAIGLDEIGTLTAMYKAIKSGEQQVEDYFPAKAKAADGVEAAKGTAGKLAAMAGNATNTHSKLPDGGKSIADQIAQGERDYYGDDAQAAQGAAKTAQEGGNAGDAPNTAESTDTPAGDEKNGASAQSDADTAGDDLSDEQVEAAEARGKKAAQRGATRDAVPPDLKGSERLKGAWLAGYDSHGGAGEGGGA